MDDTNEKEEIYITINKLFKEIDIELRSWVILNGSNIMDKVDELKCYAEKLKESNITNPNAVDLRNFYENVNKIYNLLTLLRNLISVELAKDGKKVKTIKESD